MIFLHGWPTNSTLWDSQVKEFKSKYRVITFDWLGFGKSDKPIDHKYTFTKKKQILDAVLAHFLKADQKITVVAHDIGGPPAILWASENATRIDRLILLNTVLYPFSTLLDKMSHLLFRIPILKNLVFSDFGLKTLMKTLSKSVRPEVNHKIKSIISAHAKSTVEMRKKTILEPVEVGLRNELLGLAEKFKSIDAKKYLIIARKDPLCYAHIKKLSDNNPNVPTFHIDNCGHFMAVDDSATLNEHLNSIFENQIQRL